MVKGKSYLSKHSMPKPMLWQRIYFLSLTNGQLRNRSVIGICHGFNQSPHLQAVLLSLGREKKKT